MFAVHEIGVVQDQGYILCVKVETPQQIRVQAISENLLDATLIRSHSAEGILNKNIFDLFDVQGAMSISSLIQRYDAIKRTSQRLDPANKTISLNGISQGRITVAEKVFSCSVVGCSDQVFVLELEIVEEHGEPSPMSLPTLEVLKTGNIVGNLRSKETMEAVTTTVCDDIMEVMRDYDRGIVLKFHEDWSAEVMHENVRNNSVGGQFLGLRFPADYINSKDRECYMVNGVRVIVDVNQPDTRILSTLGAPLDLSMCILRPALSSQKAQLRGLGVQSYLSIAIIIDKKLWGLYVLYGYRKPSKPSVDQRIMLEMVSSISATKIDHFQRDRDMDRKTQLVQVLRHLSVIGTLKDFLNMYTDRILKCLDVECIIVYGKDPMATSEDVASNVKRLVYGDASLVPTDEGYISLCQRCLPNSTLALADFSSGLHGDGAGVHFMKHSAANIAIVRRSRRSNVRWFSLNQLEGRCLGRAVDNSIRECREWTDNDKELASMFYERAATYLQRQLIGSIRLTLDHNNSMCVQALDAAKERYEFFAHMSHELRTLFYGIVSSLQILKPKKLEEEERKEVVEGALECGKTMLSMLHEILAIAQSQTYSETARNPVMASKLLEKTRRIMSPIAESKNVEFIVVQGIYRGASERDANEKFERKFRSASEKAVANMDGCGWTSPRVHCNDGIPQAPALSWTSALILADATRLGQVANNITSNAIKFTSAGGKVTIRGALALTDGMLDLWAQVSHRYAHSFIPLLPDVHGSERKSNGAGGGGGGGGGIKREMWFVYVVEDTGTGVGGEELKIIFDAYKQGSDKSRKTQAYQGTGLGLHICRTYIEQMNGVLASASTEGVGTAFFFAVPTILLNCETEPEPQPNSPGRSAIQTIMDWSEQEAELLTSGKPTFMLVDDSPINLRLTKRKIDLAFNSRVTVLTAIDGLEAIAMYEDMVSKGLNTSLHGIFMDYHMPKCSGLEAIHSIREGELARGIENPVYIIAFTADVADSSSNTLLDAGANEVMPKPAPTGVVESACMNLIKRSQLANVRVTNMQSSPSSKSKTTAVRMPKLKFMNIRTSSPVSTSSVTPREGRYSAREAMEAMSQLSARRSPAPESPISGPPSGPRSGPLSGDSGESVRRSSPQKHTLGGSPGMRKLSTLALASPRNPRSDATEITSKWFFKT
jgi:light-regulated signal transduction histidine kinase (bacteriophytochrome)/CheY-like chemotaxis protein